MGFPYDIRRYAQRLQNCRTKGRLPATALSRKRTRPCCHRVSCSCGTRRRAAPTTSTIGEEEMSNHPRSRALHWAVQPPNGRCRSSPVRFGSNQRHFGSGRPGPELKTRATFRQFSAAHIKLDSVGLTVQPYPGQWRIQSRLLGGGKVALFAYLQGEKYVFLPTFQAAT